MWRILAALPSLMFRVRLIRLRSSRSTFGSISTLYLPRLLYWRFSSWVTRSRLSLLKVSPSASPISFRPLSRSSDFRSLLPTRVMAHVLEEAGLVQRAHGLAGAGLVEGVAALDRQVGEDRAGADALQAFDADVADRERCERRLCPGWQRKRRSQGKGKQAAGQGSGHSEHPVAERGAGRARVAPAAGERRVTTPGAGCRCRTPAPSAPRSTRGRGTGRWPSRDRPRGGRWPAR